MDDNEKGRTREGMVLGGATRGWNRRLERSTVSASAHSVRNRVGLGVGFLLIGLGCMMLNATASPVYYSPSNYLSQWDITHKSGDGDITKDTTITPPKGYCLYIDSGTSADLAKMAFIESPKIKPSVNGDDYDIKMSIYLPLNDYQDFYILYNGHVCLFIKDNTNLKIRMGDTIKDVATLSTSKWIDLKVTVNPNVPEVKIYLDRVLQNTFYKLDGNGLDYLYMGDNSINNYGQMYFDCIQAYKIPLDTSRYAFSLLEDFNDGTTSGWAYIFHSYGGDASASDFDNKDTIDTSGASIMISSPSGEDMAYALTNTYTIDSTKPYTISMWIYIPDESNHFLYVPFNGHIKCILAKDAGKNELYCEEGPDPNPKISRLIYGFDTQTWTYIKFDVRPADKHYDIWIRDASGLSKKYTNADFRYNSASNYLAIGDIGDKGENGQNYGTIYVDQVRVDQ